MAARDRQSTDRRDFIKLLGSGVAIIPLAALTACGGGSGDEAAAPTKPAAGPESSKNSSPPAQTQQPAGTPDKPGPAELQRLSEDDAQAKALSYVHDATTVNKAAQPRYQSGQLCSNCVLYQGQAGEEWSGCSIFPGKSVNANGWCSAYAPKPATG